MVRQSDETELDVDLRITHESEALEAVVVLDVTEHGLGFDGTSASVVESLLAGEPLLGVRPVLVAPMDHLDDPLVRPARGA